MNYSAVVASPAAFGAAAALPHEGVLWLVARLMLDSAGGLFGLYLLAIFGLFLAGHVMRFGDLAGADAGVAEVFTRRGLRTIAV